MNDRFSKEEHVRFETPVSEIPLTKWSLRYFGKIIALSVGIVLWSLASKGPSLSVPDPRKNAFIDQSSPLFSRDILINNNFRDITHTQRTILSLMSELPSYIGDTYPRQVRMWDISTHNLRKMQKTLTRIEYLSLKDDELYVFLQYLVQMYFWLYQKSIIVSDSESHIIAAITVFFRDTWEVSDQELIRYVHAFTQRIGADFAPSDDGTISDVDPDRMAI